MGAIFRPQSAPPGQSYSQARATGTLRTSAVWWIRFQQNGRTVKQSTATRDMAQARTFLQQQVGRVALNIAVNVKADRLTLKDGAELIRRDCRANQRKSASTLEYRLAKVLTEFGKRRGSAGSRRRPCNLLGVGATATAWGSPAG